MAEYNFKITENQDPGGGVYKLGTGRSVTISQANYPDIDLSQLTRNNFFTRTVCNASGNASVTVNSGCNVVNEYHGGSVSLSYTYSNGTGKVTISENRPRYVVQKKEVGEDQTATAYGSYSHTIYMTKNPII